MDGALSEDTMSSQASVQADLHLPHSIIRFDRTKFYKTLCKPKKLVEDAKIIINKSGSGPDTNSSTEEESLEIESCDESLEVDNEESLEIESGENQELENGSI